MTLRPLSLGEFTAAPQASSIAPEAWHPLHSACIYAILSTSGSVHLIDAKASRSVHCWSRDELYGPATPSDAAQASSLDQHNDSASADGHGHGKSDHEQFRCVPSWSEDGSRLSVAFGAFATRPARCSVLHF